MVRLNVSLVRANYTEFTGGAIGTPITERQAAILSSLFALAFDRDVWDEMTDAEWDNLSDDLANISELLTP